MSQILTRNGTVNLTRLHQSLTSLMPPISGQARYSIDVPSDTQIRVQFPDAVATSSVQAILDSHDPTPFPTPPVPDTSDASAADQLQAAVGQLRTYLAAPSPTQADSVTALRLTIRVLLWVLKRLIAAGMFP